MKINWMGRAAGIGLALIAATPALAETFKSEYVVSLFGLTIAKSSFSTELNGGRYAISGALRSAGLAEIFDDTRGTINASGSIGKTAMEPTSYVVDYISGKKRKNTTLAFSGGGVTSISNTPPVKKGEGWVEVTAAQLKAVVDPITVFMVRGDSLASVCARTLHVFDGETRADFVLSPAGETTVATKGYSGPAMTCAMRFVPVSGYRQGKKQIEYMRKNRNMQVTFAPIGATGLYAPVLAKVGTQIGTVTIRASRFE